MRDGVLMAFKITDDCVNCGVCLDECPTNAIIMGKDRYEIEAANCNDCGACVEVCPVNAVVEG